MQSESLNFFQICRAQKMMDKTQDWKTTKVITEDDAITHKSTINQNENSVNFFPCYFFFLCPCIGEHGYSYHMIFKEEQRSFSNWINANLGGMPELAHLMPLKDDGADLYEKIGDGIIIW